MIFFKVKMRKWGNSIFEELKSAPHPNKRRFILHLSITVGHCCGKGLWGGNGGRHLLDNAISGFDHSVMMAHSGLNSWLLGSYN
jgi:hypothetical protein